MSERSPTSAAAPPLRRRWAAVLGFGTLFAAGIWFLANKDDAPLEGLRGATAELVIESITGREAPAGELMVRADSAFGAKLHLTSDVSWLSFPSQDVVEGGKGRRIGVHVSARSLNIGRHLAVVHVRQHASGPVLLTLPVTLVVKTIPGLPDLLVIDTPTVTPSPVPYGSHMTLHFTVKNQGEVDCPETETKIQIKKQGAFEQLFASIRKTPALKRGETYRHAELIRLPTSLTPGAYMAYTILDNGDQVREANAENNLLGFVAFAIAESAQPPP